MTSSPAAVNQLVALCQSVGGRVPTWVQGAGGNISVKSGGTLWIKASGWRLDAVTEHKGIAQVALSDFRAGVDAGPDFSQDEEVFYAELLTRTSRGGVSGSERPSMETGFHALLHPTFVMHFHSLPALLMPHMSRERVAPFDQWAATLDLAVTLMPPLRPGWKLLEELEQAPRSDAYVLENHGVVLCGDSLEVLELWQRAEQTFCLEFGFEQLGLLCAQPRPLASARQWASSLPPSPLRIYFPDTAVFLDRLYAELEPRDVDANGSPLFVLKSGAFDRSPDVAELWLATQMVYATCPELSELPESISTVVADLPTEKLRRKRNAPR